MDTRYPAFEYMEYATRLDSPTEPVCSLCGARPVVARCLAIIGQDKTGKEKKCNRDLCILHVGNLEQVNNNEWAACKEHVERVAAMNRHCWQEQAVNAGSVPERQRA